MHLPRWGILALFLVASLSGCIDASDDADTGSTDRRTVTPTFETYELPTDPSGLEFITTGNSEGASGIWVEDGLAYLSGGAGLRIVDVTDPENPITLAEAVEGTTASRDADLLHHSNGRTYAVLAHGGAKTTFTDVTDPRNPFLVADVTDTGPSHNIAVVPGSDVVYVSRSISTHTPQVGATGEIDIIDFSDPANPVTSVYAFPAVAMTLGGIPRPVVSTTCHDITFDVRDETLLGACAGVTNTMIWDLSDPLQPEIVQVIDWAVNQIHHGAWLLKNASILVIGDEFAGAAAGPMCSSLGQPYAALWFFDVSDMMLPIPMGYFQVSYDSVLEVDTALCTTHFGEPIEDTDLFVMGWYTAGTVLIDYSDLSNPVEVAHFRPEGGVNTWDARYWNGHIFTGDTARGMDVLRVV